jgi:hypothetical protein
LPSSDWLFSRPPGPLVTSVASSTISMFASSSKFLTNTPGVPGQHVSGGDAGAGVIHRHVAIVEHQHAANRHELMNLR